jgi:tRNA(fMet)-specific endonuclease VapC
MIPLDRPVVLDTWVLVHLTRGKEVGKAIEQRYRLGARAITPLISVVTVGEMYAFARRADWGDRRKALLDDLLRNFVIVDINRPDVLRAYADISTWLRSRGRAMGHNDRWIAATALVLDATVLTGDTDFDALHPELVTRERIDERAVLGSDP